MTGSACTLLSIDVNITLKGSRRRGNDGDSDRERESNSRKMRRLYNDWTLRPIFTGTKTTTVATARGVGGWKERERG